MDENVNIPRRRFLTAVAGAGLGGAALLCGETFGAAAPPDLKTLTDKTFAPRVGETFQIATPDGKTTVSVELADVTPYPKFTRPKASRTPFSLLFRGPAGSALPQDDYSLTNKNLGSLAGVFVVNLGLDKKKQNRRYEVVFG
ncbi:MAG TPA: hypothetical protein VMS17_33060 [Gemmataceae bacterium]|nr:hypothetical protein [Gemmataceae bacterium]